jgi:hypothetical protein
MGTSVAIREGRVVGIEEIGGITEVAAHFGIDISRMTTWHSRYVNDVPDPVLTVARGRLYVISDWKDFLRGRGVAVDGDG